jgi:hypothetical protein
MSSIFEKRDVKTSEVTIGEVRERAGGGEGGGAEEERGRRRGVRRVCTRHLKFRT